MPTDQTSREFSLLRRREIADFLMGLLLDNKLKRGAFTLAATNFKCTARSAAKIWKLFLADDLKPKKNNSGRKKKFTNDEVNARIRAIPISRRGTMRDIVAASGISMGTLNRSLKNKLIVRKSTRIKPLLTDSNKHERVKFCAAHIRSAQSGTLTFDSMMDVVHVDEKWFHLDVDKRTVYLAEGEELPHRTCKSKRFIPKVMFIAAIARPRWDHTRNKMFDGEIGIWPFVRLQPAQRDSRNRPAGTLETKCVNVDTAIYTRFVKEKIVPAIKAKFPTSKKIVFLQQDNAKPHIGNNDSFLSSESTDGWKYLVRNQPPNSPDLNCLDLGIFHSIQSLQHKTFCKSIDELIAATENAFVSLPSDKANDIFLTLQTVMQLVMQHSGDNKFPLPHTGKAKLKRKGKLPTAITCSLLIYSTATAFVESEGVRLAEVAAVKKAETKLKAAAKKSAKKAAETARLVARTPEEILAEDAIKAAKKVALAEKRRLALAATTSEMEFPRTFTF